MIVLSIFSVLITLENNRNAMGESINSSGKMRYFSATLMHEIMEFQDNNDPSNILIQLNDFERNFNVLRSLLSSNVDFILYLPDDSEPDFVYMYNTFLNLKSELIADVKNGVISKERESFYDNTLEDMINSSNKFTQFLAKQSIEISKQITLLEIILCFTLISINIVLVIFTVKIQKKESDRASQISREFEDYRTALNKSAIVAITDSKGKIIFVNKKFCDISKYTEKELIGKNHRMLKSGQHSEEFYKDMWNTISSGNVWQGLVKNKAKDGTFYWVATSIVPLLNSDGKVEQYISIRQDITKQIQLENELIQKEKLSIIGELSARLTHDLRNPLSVIQMSVENLKTLFGNDEKKQIQFEKIDRSIDRIVHQVEGVLDFIKTNPINFQNVMLSEVIKESLESIRIPKTIKLVLPKKDAQIYCDKQQISIALNNLILNAIQATDEKGLVIISFNEQSNHLEIQIEDSGKGISKENLPHIFEPLFTTKQKGTGLGLVSVKSIVEAHGGTISVTSPPTIFTITLPKKHPESDHIW